MMSRSKRLVPFALFAACLAAMWAPKLTGAAPSCDPDNGGITLPAGFCALVVADGLGEARHLAVAPNGDVYVALMRGPGGRGQAGPGGVVALHDGDGDGRFETKETIPQREHDRHRAQERLPVRRAPAQRAALQDDVRPAQAGRRAGDDRHGFAARSPARRQGHCLRRPRLALYQYRRALQCLPAAGSPPRRQGRRSVPAAREERRHLEVRREQDRIRSRRTAARFATGLRQMPALAWHDDALFIVMNNRDQLDLFWPEKFTAKDNAERPAEPMYRAVQGSDFGWPYCYFDYGRRSWCSIPSTAATARKWAAARSSRHPVAAYPAHWAPVDVMFYSGTQFPQKYRDGAFIAFHGSWNRAPMPQDGYNVTFQPFAERQAVGRLRSVRERLRRQGAADEPERRGRARRRRGAGAGRVALHHRQPERPCLARALHRCKVASRDRRTSTNDAEMRVASGGAGASGARRARRPRARSSPRST